MRYPKYTRSFEVIAKLPEPLEPLRRLAMNFRWTWHPETRQLFRSIDKRLWDEVEHNPIQVLRRLSEADMRRLAEDEVLLARLRVASEDLDGYLVADTWYGREHAASNPELSIAYFCAEFGLAEALPIYSGGLGVLAGDHLKAASDLGLPLVGVGLLYSRGYFRQFLNSDGWQEEHYPKYDFYQLPLVLERGADGQPLRVEVEMPDRTITCQVWRADVGRVPLYLLDSNVLENAPDDQTITDTLYGGDEEMRIRQEMILGIGGMRALEALGRKPTVCHMNEGHAAFLAIERIRRFMVERNAEFYVSRQVTLNGNVFTTHTPVPAGFDVFSKDLVRKYLSPIAAEIGLGSEEFGKLGRMQPNGGDERFNMAVLAMNTANRINGVSKLHAQVSRGLFQARWPDVPENEVPIDPITNGVHTLTWIGARMCDLLDRHLGEAWRDDPSNPEVWRGVRDIPDEDVWAVRERQRGDFVRYVRRRVQRDVERRGGRLSVQSYDEILDPRVLTIGFARRFATYKRATLLLTDRDRLKRILFNGDRGVQFVLAGKSHPRDDGGKRFIQELYRFIESGGVRARMVFLEDYDMGVARHMVQGVDLWLNNPRRPLEASGTSGMKVVPNGGLNFSVMDGWWDEGYSPAVGWAIGDRRQVGDEGEQDRLDAQALYRTLEDQIVPRFYQKLNGDPPRAWVEMIKESMARLGPQFSTDRMVKDYATKFYLPAHAAYMRLASDDLSRAWEAFHWQAKVRAEWDAVKVVSVTDDLGAENALGGAFRLVAEVSLGSLTPEDVAVEALVGRVGANRELEDAERVELDLAHRDGSIGRYEATVTLRTAGLRGYVVRVRPRHDAVRVATELPLVAWN
ncbi:MAG: alpha-glucan family phosphorylase [Fimbriimonadaceae bacterium]|nr:alpha-glucan family phosphorylase [Fimbriimonadaceae bacterium]